MYLNVRVALSSLKPHLVSKSGLPPPPSLVGLRSDAPPLLSVRVCVCVCGYQENHYSQKHMAFHFSPRYLRLLSLSRMAVCLWAGQLQPHRGVRPPQASDLGVISGAARLCDVLPRGHTGFLVENGPKGGFSAHGQSRQTSSLNGNTTAVWEYRSS